MVPLNSELFEETVPPNNKLFRGTVPPNSDSEERFRQITNYSKERFRQITTSFRTGTPWELLYADDLVISAETEEGLKMKLNKWKTEMEAKGLRVNMGKTKIMVSGVNLQTLKDSGK